MTSELNSLQTAQSLEGQRLIPTGPEDRRKIIELAFDYRGDVTLELRSGSHLEGYVFDRNHHGPEPYLKIFPKEGTEARRVPFEEIVAIAFSGEDTAFGKSWEDWHRKMQKMASKKATD